MMVSKTIGWSETEAGLGTFDAGLPAIEALLAAYRCHAAGELWYFRPLGSWHGFEDVMEISGHEAAKHVWSGYGPRIRLDFKFPLSDADVAWWTAWGMISGPYRPTAVTGFVPTKWRDPCWYYWYGRGEGFESSGWTGRRYWITRGAHYARRLDREHFTCPPWVTYYD